MVLTARLPKAYTPVIISFDATENSKLTLNFIIMRLLNEEGRQATPSFVEVKKEDPNNAALNTTKFSSKIQCFYCMLMGHYSSACPKQASNIKEKEEEGCK